MRTDEDGARLVLTGENWGAAWRDAVDLAGLIGAALPDMVPGGLPPGAACEVSAGPDAPGHPPLIIVLVSGLPQDAPGGQPLAAWHAQLDSAITRAGNEWNQITASPGRAGCFRAYELAVRIPPAPPHLQVQGPEAVLAGVRFAWELHCSWCWQQTRLYSAGRITAGIQTSRSRKTCRWQVRHAPGRMPQPPAECHLCGKPGAFETWQAREAEPLADDVTTLPVLDSAYRQLRAAYPAEAAAADEALRRASRQPPRTLS